MRQLFLNIHVMENRVVKYCIILIVELQSIWQTQGYSSTWSSVNVNVTIVTAGLHLEIAVPSEVICAMRAMHVVDHNVYCYNEGRCLVGHGDPQDIRGPATLGWKCKSEGNMDSVLT